MKSLARIFISVAAYREIDLLPTLRDCIARASHPERLRFCICWQHDEEDSLEEFAHDPRVDVIAVPYRESRGVSWARNAIQRRWAGEEFALQLDAHHRFVDGWDELLIGMLGELREAGVPKPLLTGYLPPFDPDNDPAGRLQQPCLTAFDRFSEDGVVFMQPRPVDAARAPIPSRFWCAHFSFASGHFNEEVVIDPSGYFHGEEITMCVRAWTAGYDLYTPHRLVAWHEYTRRGKVCHWDDHPIWVEWHRTAIDAYRRMFGVDGLERTTPQDYGFGSQRTLEQYERFAGLHFASRGVTPYTLTHQPPPDPHPGRSEDAWHRSLLRTPGCQLRVQRSVVDPPGCAAWKLFLYSEDGSVLHREHMDRSSIDATLEAQTGAEIVVTSPFTSPRRATGWTLITLDASRRRLGRVTGHL